MDLDIIKDEICEKMKEYDWYASIAITIFIIFALFAGEFILALIFEKNTEGPSTFCFIVGFIISIVICIVTYFIFKHIKESY